MTTRVEGLQIGDYTIAGFENDFSIDRKSIDDLVHSLNPAGGKDRFQRLVKKATELYRFAVVIEGYEGEIRNHDYYSQLHPNVVFGTIDAWEHAYGIEFIFAGDRQSAQLLTLNLLEQWRSELLSTLV